jgi:hypothetical protein
MSKKAGRHSQSANDFLEPKPVENLTATDVGTSRTFDNGAVDLSWELPVGSPEATSYSITTNPATSTYTTSNTSYQVTGLSSSTSYTFLVTGSNAAGTSAATESSSVTVTTVPAKPISVSAASPNADQDVVTWSAGANGGKSITSYTVVSSDGPSYTNQTSPATINETADTSQTYTIYAINDNGTSEGETTGSVTTTAPFFPPFFPYFPPFFPFFPPFFPFFPYFPPFFPYFPPFFPPYFPPFFPFFPYFPPYFPPFFPFFPYFPPFFPPRFGPYFTRCVDEDTLILTSNGLTSAKDIKMGDSLLTVDVQALESGQGTFDLNTTDLNINSKFVMTEITNIIVAQKADRVYFNNDHANKFTETHPIFIKRNSVYRVVEASSVTEGDVIIIIDPNKLHEFAITQDAVSEITVTSVTKETLDNPKDVYTFSCDPYNWYFAGNILTHNK